MSYLRDDPEADFEFETDSAEDDDVRDPGLAQFRLENIKDRPPIYDADALHEVYEDFAWEEPSDFTQLQVLSMPDATELADINDDLARELAFYKQGKAAAEAAIAKFEASGMPWLRPPDYYAENVKADGHMAKVKEQLMYEQRLIEDAEQRRKNRENKQYSKQVQAEKQKERVREKKEQISSITKLRKQRASSGFDGDLEFDKDMKVKQQRLAPDKAGQRIRKDANPANKQRQAKDAKFGFGGRKKLKKQNNAESAADMNAMSKGLRPGGKKALGTKGGVKKRPGKDARQAKQGRSSGDRGRRR